MEKQEAINVIQQLINGYKGTPAEHQLLADAVITFKRLEEPKTE